MPNWLKRRWADLTTNVMAGLLLMAITAAATTGGVVAWSFLSSAPTVFMVTAGIFALGGTALLVNQGLGIARRLRERQLPWATVLHLAQPYLSGLNSRLCDLVYENTVRGRTFENCVIYGPAIVWAEGAGIVHACEFDGPKEAVFIEVAAGQTQVIGAIRAIECVFRRCQFKGVGFLGTAQLVAEWKQQN